MDKCQLLSVSAKGHDPQGRGQYPILESGGSSP